MREEAIPRYCGRRVIGTKMSARNTMPPIHTVAATMWSQTDVK
jgi:hypothetical protein